MNERGFGLVGHCFGEHGLSCARQAVEQHSSRRLNADIIEDRRIGERQLHSFPDLLNLALQAAHLSIRHIRSLYQLHDLGPYVHRAIEYANNCQRIVDAHTGIGLNQWQ